MSWTVRLLALLAALLLTPLAVTAQSLPGADEAPAEVAADPYGRQTPRSTVTGLLNALGDDDYVRAAHYFVGVDDPATPVGEPAAGPTEGEVEEPTADAATVAARETERRQAEVARAAALARKLKIALDAGGTLQPFAALSNAPAGDVGDQLAANQERVGTLSTGGEGTPILLQQVGEADGTTQWRLAPATAEAIAAWRPAEPLRVTAEEDEPVNVFGAPLFDWLQLLAVAIGSWLVFRLITGAVLTTLRRFLPDPESSPVYRFLHAAMPPLALYLAVITFFLTADQLAVSIVARQTLLRYAGIVAWVALAWFLLRLVNAVARLATARMRRAERRQAVSIITFLRRGAKLLLLAIAAVAVLDTVGLDVTTGIAALGIGGIALALGAQKTIENLVGSVTLIIDKPVQVGDAAQIGDVFGTVEDIGMRSTRVRTNERTVVSIPNGDLAAERIENFALRDRFLFHQTIGVTYDTSAGQMEDVLARLRAILRDSETIIDEEARVRFHGFGDSALDIEIFAYFRTRSYPDSLAMQEELLFAIMRALDELGVDIAFPTQTVRLRPDGNGTG